MRTLKTSDLIKSKFIKLDNGFRLQDRYQSNYTNQTIIDVTSHEDHDRLSILCECERLIVIRFYDDKVISCTGDKIDPNFISVCVNCRDVGKSQKTLCSWCVYECFNTRTGHQKVLCRKPCENCLDSEFRIFLTQHEFDLILESWLTYVFETDHFVKIWSLYFERVLSGDKKAEIRLDDRGYKIGDIVMLQDYDPNFKAYTGKFLFVKITDIIRDYGLQDDFIVFSFDVLNSGGFDE